MSQNVQFKPVTVPWVRHQKDKKQVTMLTAYDYPIAKILDEAGIDMVLVGDSLGTVIYGKENTLSVTMDDVVRHCQAVAPACQRAMVVGDLPFLSYQVSLEQAVQNAGRLIQEAGAQAVKLEGGMEWAPTVQAITRAGIPVMGHIGLMPQTIHQMGRYRTHGKTFKERAYLLESAKVLQEAGAFSLVLECVEAGLACEISRETKIPCIGIGSGPHCDGQVLVTHDLVGLTPGRVPSFARPEVDLSQVFSEAVCRYIARTQSESQMPTASPAPGLTQTPPPGPFTQRPDRLKESSTDVASS